MIELGSFDAGVSAAACETSLKQVEATTRLPLTLILAETLHISPTESCLGVGVSLVGGFPEPLHRLTLIPSYTLTLPQVKSQLCHGIWIALLGSLSVPGNGQ